jgi:hypothetical protein
MDRSDQSIFQYDVDVLAGIAELVISSKKCAPMEAAVILGTLLCR